MKANDEKLRDMTVAVLVTEGFEQIELTSPKQALHEAGADVLIVSPIEGAVSAWDGDNWGDAFHVDVAVRKADADDFDALLLPGGVMSPDKLRRDADALKFVQRFFEQDKPVAAICHGPWTLIDAGVVRGRRMTSYHTLQTDLKNAGAEWVNQAVVVDGSVVTSRNPDDLPQFNQKVIELFAQYAVTHRAGAR